MKKYLLLLAIFLLTNINTAFAENYDSFYPYDFIIIPWYSDVTNVSIVVPNPHADNRMIFIQLDDNTTVNVVCNGYEFMNIQNEFTCKSRLPVIWTNARSHRRASGTFQITPIL